MTDALDSNSLLHIGSINGPTLSQLENNTFLPQYVTTPDKSLQLQLLGGLSSNAAATPNVDFLNRSILNLGTDQTTNIASIQSDTQIIEKLLNTNSISAQTFNTFLPNGLDGFDNVTYNFKLYMAPEAQLLNPNTNPTGPFYIVAQSGVSANFYIKDVEIESIVAPNPKTRNVKSNVFRMSIVEPQGVSLVDKLIAAATQLGIKNISVCPLILELTFKGYNSTSGQQAPTNIFTRTWRVQLQNIETTMNEGGSEYKLYFMLLQDYAFNKFSAAAIIQQQLTFPVTTLGQFFQDLSYYLTLQSYQIAKNGQIAQNQYVFNLNPAMSKWVIGSTDKDRNAPSMFIDSNGKKSIVLSTNMTIDRIVDVVIASTKEGNEMVNPSSTLGKMDSAPEAPKISKIASITGKVEFLGYNATANDYGRKYTYYINPYDTFRTIIDKPDESDQQTRVQYLLQNSLKKKYQYIFTGQNTDILRLDLDLNNLWRATNTYYASALQRKNNVNSKFTDIKNKTSTVTSQDDLRDDAKTSSFAFTPVPGSQDAIVMQYTQIQPQGLITQSTPIPNPPLVTDPRTATISSLDQLSSNNSVDQTKLVTAINAFDQATLSSPAVQDPSANNPTNIPVLTGALSRLLPSPINTLLSGLTTNTINSNNPQGQLIETLNNNPNISIPTILTMYVKQLDPELDTNRVSTNIEENTNLGRSIYGIVTNQLYGVKSTDLLSIDMEIRGDPYWLGESDIEIFNRLNSTSDITAGNTTTFANYLKGENCLFLTFNTPKNFNESTGFVDVQQSDLYVGVYTVITVLHTFSDGKFTQKLNCIRDIQTDAKVLGQYVNAQGNQTSTTGVNNNLFSLINKIL